MRRTLLSLSLLLIGSIGYSQVDIPDVDISKRKEYVMKNYNVDSKKADRYEDILHSLQQEKEQLIKESFIKSMGLLLIKHFMMGKIEGGAFVHKN